MNNQMLAVIAQEVDYGSLHRVKDGHLVLEGEWRGIIPARFLRLPEIPASDMLHRGEIGSDFLETLTGEQVPAGANAIFVTGRSRDCTHFEAYYVSYANDVVERREPRPIHTAGQFGEPTVRFFEPQYAL